MALVTFQLDLLASAPRVGRAAAPIALAARFPEMTSSAFAERYQGCVLFIVTWPDSLAGGFAFIKWRVILHG